MPFAQKHYPFENKNWFESHFPSDFIVEYTGQIRCWFYYLHVLSVALFDKPAFQNCIVHGTILAKDGKKLSKSSKNYTDPMQLMKQYGTDAFRLYLYQTNAMLIGDLLFDESGIQDAYQQIVLPYWNACNFYISYANIDGFQPKKLEEPVSDNQLDQWMLAKLYETQQLITSHMDSYQVNKYVEYMVSLVDGLTNWYIRRSRRRFWSSGMSKDKQSAYQTMYYVLVCTTKLFAPVAPVISEKMFKVLTGEVSVHLSQWPEVPKKFKKEELLENVALVQEVIYLARSIRNKNRVKNRQPLNSLKVALPDSSKNSMITEFKEIIADELNVKNIEILEDANDIADVKYAPNFNEIRNRYPDRIAEIIKAVKSGKFQMEGNTVFLQMDDKEPCVASKEESFDAEIILVAYQAKEGQHVASSHGIVVSLDLTLTEELKAEGFARDIVRNIQDARKQIGCEITDTVLLAFEGEVPGEWLEYICKETLGQTAAITDPETVIEIEAEKGKEVKISVSRT